MRFGDTCIGLLGSGAILNTPAAPDYYRIAFHVDATGKSNGTGYTTDNSRHGHTMTYNGNAAVASNKFEFDGSGDFIELPASVLWTPGCKFTIEILNFQTDKLTDNQGVFCQYSADLGKIGWIVDVNSGALRFTWSTNGTSTTHILTGPTLSTGGVYNIAVCWDGSTVFLVLDGTIVASTAFTGRFANPPTTLRLGARANNDIEQDFLDGRFSAIIFTKGECLYSSAYEHVMPSVPRTITTPTLTDALWPKVSYLVAYDETLSRLRDFGPLDLPLVPAGNVAGNASGSIGGSDNTIDFDGTGDFLTIPHDTLTSITDGVDFCMDAYLNPSSLAHLATIQNKRASGGADASLSISTTGKLGFSAWGSGTVRFTTTGTTTIATGTSHHVGGSLQGSSARGLLDGAVDGTATKSAAVGTSTADRYIGRDGSDTSRDFQGSMAWSRFTKGDCRFSGSYTPPTGVLPAG